MSPPTQRGGVPAQHPAPETSRHQAADQSEGSAERLARAKAFAAPPAGRRTLWTLVVPRCPFCAHLHLHRGTGPHPGRRVGSCGTAYFLVIAGSKRGRWSR